DRVTGKVAAFAPDAKIIHVDIDPTSISKTVRADIPITGPVDAVLNEMIAQVEDAKRSGSGEPDRGAIDAWWSRIQAWREAHGIYTSPRYEVDGSLIMPPDVIKALWEVTGGKAYVTSDVGQHQMFAAQYFGFNKPRTWVTSGGLGTMGFGLPAAMGAQAAHPLKTCIDIDGDGSFLMNIQELACCFVEKLPVKVLLLNNQHLGMVVQWEDRFFEGNRAHTYLGAGPDRGPYPDFVTIAKGFSCNARRISEKGDLDSALIEMIESKGPYVLDVMIPHQEHVLPMIPSGMTVRDMIKT
ncbi:MAG: thiamine pyrophosphate-dependent enzyme, partial [Gemmataceae bacterium]